MSLSPAAQGAERAAHQLLPSLLRLVSASGGDFVVPAASLACVLLEKVLAPSSWIPILERGINLTSALTAAFTTPPTPSDTSLSPHQATSSPADATSPQEALLLLALQAAQVSDGAVMLVDQGMPALLVSLCAWLQSPPPGGSLMGESPSAAVDYSNAYAADGTPLLAQRLWCCVLALTGLLLAALPGHAAVEGAALQVVLSMDARLQLALAPPEATARQPVTLAMAQEAKYALFLLCSVSKFAGQWRLAMPTALPALRRASASLLRFLAGGLFEGAVCCPVSRAERAAAAGDGPTQLLGGWFKQCSEVASAGGAHDGRRGTSDAACSSFGWDVAEKLCSCVQFALGFQLETAPEVSEAELPSLGPEWVGPNAVRVLLDSFHETVAGAVGLGKGLSPAGHRVLRSATSVLKACMQLASLLCIRLSGATVQEVQEALAAAEDILETRNAV